MANLTITVDEQLLKQARLRALREGTSVNRLLRERLESYVKDDERRRKAIQGLLRLSRAARSGSGGAGCAAKTCMASRTFFDTNVLVYLFDADSPDKQDRAREALRDRLESGAVVVSTQVLQEFFVTVTRKLARPLPAAEAEGALHRLMALPVVQVDPDLVLAAAVSSRRGRISFWDALILTAAAVAGCEEVLSEDLQHGQSFGRVRIVNPFRD